jgi:hypothetical protein
VASRQLETAGRIGELAQAPALIDQIEPQIPPVAAYLQQSAPPVT